MQKMPARGDTCPGIDVSRYQRSIDWMTVAESGIQFAFSKASEYSIDQTFSKNKKGAKEAGLLFGAYHFLHPSLDPIAQAERFLKSADPKPGELPLMLDWETTDNVPSAIDRERALTFLNYLQAKTGKAPIIYVGPYFAQALQLTDEFLDFPLYVAHYGTSAPLVPQPWTYWSFHQFSGSGHVDGVSTPVDLDRWNGSLEQLKTMVL